MKLYNTMTRKKEEFIPLVPGEVKMYSCGPTVYNFFHIGNARPFIIFDTLRRYFEFLGYDVKFVQNFTDIDDKMIKNANEQGVTVRELADRFIDEYFKDAKGLSIREATVHPRATDNIDAIIETIKTLIDKGFAYEAEGDVYLKLPVLLNMASFPVNPWRTLLPVPALALMNARKTPWTLLCGKIKKKANRLGPAPGVKADPVGTLSVLPWLTAI